MAEQTTSAERGANAANQKAIETLVEVIIGLGRTNRDKLADIVTEDVHFHFPAFSRGIMPDPIGAEQILDFLTLAGDAMLVPGTVTWEPHVMVADNLEGAAIGTLRCRVHTGDDYENTYAFGANFTDGLISEIWELVCSLIPPIDPDTLPVPDHLQ
jgi:ketosteroid isomerase-like protein